MESKDLAIGILLALLALSIFGSPSSFRVGPLSWDISASGGTIRESIPTSTILATTAEDENPLLHDISIETFDTRQKLYKLYDFAYADFTIKNTLGVPFNFSVDWFHNDTRYTGWSSDNNETRSNTRSWWSNIRVYEKGAWQAYLLVKYKNRNQEFAKEAFANFIVI